MPYRPVCMQGARGALTQFHGGHLHCAMIITNMLVGALDVPGSGKGDLGPQHKCTPYNLALKPDQDGTVAPKVEAVPRDFEFPPKRLDGKTYFPFAHDTPHITMDAILNPKKYHVDYTPEVMLAWGGNMVLRCHQPEKARGGAAQVQVHLRAVVLARRAGLDGRHRPARGRRPGALVGRRARRALPRPRTDPSRWSTASSPSRPSSRCSIRSSPTRSSWNSPSASAFCTARSGLNAQINTGTLTPIKLVAPFLLDVEQAPPARSWPTVTIKSAFGENASVDACRNNAEVPKRVLPNKAAYPYGGFPGSQTRYALYMDRLKTYGEDLIGNLERANAFLPGLGRDVLEPHFSPLIALDREAGRSTRRIWTCTRSTGSQPSSLSGWAARRTIRGCTKSPSSTLTCTCVCLNPRRRGRPRPRRTATVIWVESKFGKVQGKVKVSEAFHPEVVGIGGLVRPREPGDEPAGAPRHALQQPDVAERGGLRSAGRWLRRRSRRSRSTRPRRKQPMRYGMVIDLRKCVGCNACTLACRQEHGTPSGNSVHPGAEPEVGTYPNTRFEIQPLLCMHCDEPAVREGLSDRRHSQAGKRDRAGGRRQVHRLPLLHDRLSLQRALLQLQRAEGILPRDRARPRTRLAKVARARQRHGGEMHLLRRARGGRACSRPAW